MATRIGLDDLTPPQLAAARFLIAALPAVVLARPRVAWPALIAVGLTLFAGQFILQFFGIAGGMPPGLASVVVQMQAIFTFLFAAPLLHERPTALQTCGLILGLAAILYLGAVATVGAYAIWGDLLRMVLLGLAVIVLPWPRQAAA